MILKRQKEWWLKKCKPVHKPNREKSSKLLQIMKKKSNNVKIGTVIRPKIWQIRWRSSMLNYIKKCKILICFTNIKKTFKLNTTPSFSKTKQCSQRSIGWSSVSKLWKIKWKVNLKRFIKVNCPMFSIEINSFFAELKKAYV